MENKDNTVDSFAEKFADEASANEDPVEEQDTEVEQDDTESEAEVEDDLAEQGDADETVETPDESEDDPYAEILSEEKPEVAGSYDEVAEKPAGPSPEIDQIKAQNQELINFFMQVNDLVQPNDNLRDPSHEDYNPDQFNADQLAYERKKEMVQEVRQKQAQQMQQQQQAEYERRMELVKQRNTELRESRPHLFGDRGPKIISKIEEAAMAAGLPKEELPFMSAGTISLIDDALRYRSGVKKLANAKTKKASKPVSKSMRKGPSKSSGAKQALKKTGSVDDFGAKFLADAD